VVPALSEREKKESNRNNRNDDMESQSSREGAEKEKNLLPVFPFPSFFCPLPSLFEREKTTFHRQSKNVHNSSGRFSPPPPESKVTGPLDKMGVKKINEVISLLPTP
jgi:hypothetical protein